ncbi:MAG: hypothetical protein CMJ18_27630 [Phycisphaeraceae bacterium]|nr:hypothetical protein [Phycisphaeraceae bacterium]
MFDISKTLRRIRHYRKRRTQRASHGTLPAAPLWAGLQPLEPRLLLTGDVEVALLPDLTVVLDSAGLPPAVIAGEDERGTIPVIVTNQGDADLNE